METVEAHHHKTGHSKADLILGCLAVVMSMVSVFIAMRDERTMERMVAASTWPNINISSSNDIPSAPRTITLDLRNTGVGPARIETLEVFYKDKPMSSSRELMAACCGPGKPNYSISDVRDQVLPARDQVSLMTVPAAINPPEVYRALDAARRQLRVRVCYCSVFDECWVADDAARRPARVQECAPSQPVEFNH
jgi:hypothetical protein